MSLRSQGIARVMSVVWAVAAAAIVAAPMGLSPEGQKAAAPDLAVNARGELALLWVDRSPQEQAGADAAARAAAEEDEVEALVTPAAAALAPPPPNAAVRPVDAAAANAWRASLAPAARAADDIGSVCGERGGGDRRQVMVERFVPLGVDVSRRACPVARVGVVRVERVCVSVLVLCVCVG